MRYLYTFENFTATTPKAVTAQQQSTLMDKTIDKEITEEEKEKLIADNKVEEIKRKKILQSKKKKIA
jgi:hypothetical protein